MKNARFAVGRLSELLRVNAEPEKFAAPFVSLSVAVLSNPVKQKSGGARLGAVGFPPTAPGFNSQHLHLQLWNGWASVKPSDLINRELLTGFCGFNSRPFRTTKPLKSLKSLHFLNFLHFVHEHIPLYCNSVTTVVPTKWSYCGPPIILTVSP